MDAPRAAGLNQLADRLREAGLRATAPRLAVLGELVASPGHHAADEITDRLTQGGVGIARASVYNVLDDLVRCELVMLADAGPGRALYEVADTVHHHFVCRRCGVVRDVPCAVGQRPCLDVELPGAQIDEAQVILRGVCASCVDGRSLPAD